MPRLAVAIGLLVVAGCRLGYPDEEGAGDGGTGDGGGCGAAEVGCTDPCTRCVGDACVPVEPPAGCTTSVCGDTCLAHCPQPVSHAGAQATCAGAWCLVTL